MVMVTPGVDCASRYAPAYLMLCNVSDVCKEMAVSWSVFGVVALDGASS